MKGESLHYKKHIVSQTGQYFQVNEGENHCNRNRPHTKGAIFMGPIGNMQGGFNFMILRPMEKITKRSWDMILMPDTVIGRAKLFGKY